MKNINPKVLKFLKAHGLPIDTINRDSDGEIKWITLNGKHLMWTVHYNWWVYDTLNEWAKSIGFGYEDGRQPYESAGLCRCGHTREEFDAWLSAKYGWATNE